MQPFKCLITSLILAFRTLINARLHSIGVLNTTSEYSKPTILNVGVDKVAPWSLQLNMSKEAIHFNSIVQYYYPSVGHRDYDSKINMPPIQSKKAIVNMAVELQNDFLRGAAFAAIKNAQRQKEKTLVLLKNIAELELSTQSLLNRLNPCHINIFKDMVSLQKLKQTGIDLFVKRRKV